MCSALTLAFGRKTIFDDMDASIHESMYILLKMW